MRRFDLTSIIGVVIVITVMLRPGGLAQDPGVGWHLANGLRMLDDRTILRTDPFTHPPDTKPWVQTQWLSDVVIAAVYRLGGWPLVELLFITAGVLITVLLLPWSLRKLRVFAVAELLGVLAAAIFLHIQWFIRPTMISFVLFPLVFLGLNDRTQLLRNRYWYPVMFALWANLHSGFLFAFLLFGTKFLELATLRKFREAREIVFVSALCLLAACLNPWGYELLVQGFGLATSGYFQRLNQEWLPPELSSQSGLFLLLATAATLLAFTFSGVGNRFERISLLVLLVFAFKSRRYIPFLAFPFGFCFAVFFSEWLEKGRCLERFRILQGFGRASFPRAVVVLLLLLIGAVFYSGHLPGKSAKDSQPPFGVGLRRQIDFCRQSGGKNILASPDLGGLLIWEGSLKPFIDDRNELHGVESYKRYFRLISGGADWQQLLMEFAPDCVILTSRSPLSEQLRTLGWRELQVDNELVFVAN